MNILAIMGSYRKGQTIDTLVDKAIEGARSRAGVQAEKICLVDMKINYCRNCMVCRNDDPTKERARCVISDDMDIIGPMIEKADGYIIGTPVNMATVTAVMKTFLERACWVFAKPGRWPLAGCPTPRTTRKKAAVAIISSGIVPPLLRWFCDDATSLIKDFCRDALNAKLVGTFYAGAMEKRGVETYLAKAYELGKKLVAGI
jgi:multimeric flavodoxin WrbA